MFNRVNWDSNFFGINIVKITADISSKDCLIQALSASKLQKVDLLVVESAPEQIALKEWCVQLGAKYVGTKITYDLFLGNQSPKNNRIEVAKRDLTSVKQLRKLALDSSEYSRFRIDQDIPKGGWQRLYYEWINKSLSGEMADTILVNMLGSSITGMVTVKIDGNHGIIGLLCIDSSHKRVGLGATLVDDAISYCLMRGCHTLSVSTQLENIPACRLYEKKNFTYANEISYFHFWIKHL